MLHNELMWTAYMLRLVKNCSCICELKLESLKQTPAFGLLVAPQTPQILSYGFFQVKCIRQMVESLLIAFPTTGGTVSLD